MKENISIFIYFQPDYSGKMEIDNWDHIGMRWNEILIMIIKTKIHIWKTTVDSAETGSEIHTKRNFKSILRFLEIGIF